MNHLFAQSDLITLLPSIVLIACFILLVANKSKVIRAMQVIKTFLF